MFFRLRHFLFVFAVLLLLVSGRSSAQSTSEPEQLIENARVTFTSMLADAQYPGLASLAGKAKAILIVPNLLRESYFFGGRGGNAVLLVRGVHGRWSDPAFYTLGDVSWGLRLHGQTSELVVTVMTDKGLRAIMERAASLGYAHVSIGALGQGVEVAPDMDLKADMYAFARSGGAFVGVSLEDSVVAPRETWNQEIYGGDAAPDSILLTDPASRHDPASLKAVSDLVAAMP